MQFTAVVVSHGNLQGLKRMLANLAEQSQRPDEVLVFCSGYTPAVMGVLEHTYRGAKFHTEPDLDDWGHNKRAKGLSLAASEWVGFFNDDDSYDQNYIREMLKYPESHVVYCGWNEQPGCTFNAGSSTAGNFIVRTEVGRKAGYPDDRVYENDGVFINRLNSHAEQIVKVDAVLYHHNVDG